MIWNGSQRISLVAAVWAATNVAAQQPFDLDPNFRTSINENYVNSMTILYDGGIFISGRIKFPGDQNYRGSAKLLPNGQQDTAFPSFPQTTGGGKIIPWNDQFYVLVSATVRRLTYEGLVDPSFAQMNNDPYFTSNQGGDYHVFPDGRVLLTGAHGLNDTVRGFTGTHHLIWFTNTGYLDTTRIHRRCGGNSAIYDIEPLPDGKFLLSGVLSSYEGTPVGRIFRVHPDGALDTTFQTSIHWGQAVGYHQQADGKVIAAGRFLFQGDPDTLHLVRLMPDGQLDTTFNNHLRSLYNAYFGPTHAIAWSGIQPLYEDRFIVYGGFTSIDEQARGGIAVIDTSGNLVDAPIGEGGCGQFVLFNINYGSIAGITETPDGNYYIWGSYHGYDDGTTNDPTQRMVSRLYGLNVGMRERTFAPLRIQPNPTHGPLCVTIPEDFQAQQAEVVDTFGRLVWRMATGTHVGQVQLELGSLMPGTYLLRLRDRDGSVRQGRVVIMR